MKILIYIALYKRKEVTRVCFDALKELNPKGFEIDVFCVVSEEIGEKLAKEYGFKYVWATDRPLGKKKNEGLRATSNLDYDYLLELGSDDVLCPSIFDFYKPYFNSREPYFGVNEYFLIHPSTGRAKYWKYDVNHPIGAGRCIRKDLLENLDFTLWQDGQERGLDTKSDVTLIKSGYRCLLKETEGYPYVIDIKSDENLWSFDEVAGKNVEYDFVRNNLPEGCVESLKVLEGLTVEL